MSSLDSRIFIDKFGLIEIEFIVSFYESKNLNAKSRYNLNILGESLSKFLTWIFFPFSILTKKTNYVINDTTGHHKKFHR